MRIYEIDHSGLGPAGTKSAYSSAFVLFTFNANAVCLRKQNDESGRQHRPGVHGNGATSGGAPTGRPRIQVVDFADGVVGFRFDCPRRIRTLARLAFGSPEIRMALSLQFRMGPGERAVRGVAIHLRNGRFVADRPECHQEILCACLNEAAT